jgi:hypothetical protein
MKNSLIILTLCIISATPLSIQTEESWNAAFQKNTEPKTKSDREKAHLKGLVHTVHERYENLNIQNKAEREQGPWSIVTYDQNGKRIKTEHKQYGTHGVLESEGESVRIHDPVKDTEEEARYSPDGTLVSKKVYDPDGNQIETVGFNRDGSLQYKWTWLYDSFGNVIEKTNYKNGGNINFKNVFIYDDDQNCTEINTFNAKGVLTSKEAFTYEYDSNGNWIKQVRLLGEVENGQIDLKPIGITHRAITYY